MNSIPLGRSEAESYANPLRFLRPGAQLPDQMGGALTLTGDDGMTWRRTRTGLEHPELEDHWKVRVVWKNSGLSGDGSATWTLHTAAWDEPRVCQDGAGEWWVEADWCQDTEYGDVILTLPGEAVRFRWSELATVGMRFHPGTETREEAERVRAEADEARRMERAEAKIARRERENERRELGVYAVIEREAAAGRLATERGIREALPFPVGQESLRAVLDDLREDGRIERVGKARGPGSGWTTTAVPEAAQRPL